MTLSICKPLRSFYFFKKKGKEKQLELRTNIQKPDPSFENLTIACYFLKRKRRAQCAAPTP